MHLIPRFVGVRLIACGAVLASMIGCATFARPERFRTHYDREQFVVEFIDYGHIFETEDLRDRTDQAIRVRIDRRTESPWTALSHSSQKQIVDGVVEPLSTGVRPEPNRMLFLLPLEPFPYDGDPLKRLAHDKQFTDGDTATMRQIERQYLWELDSAKRVSAMFLLVCVSPNSKADRCMVHSRAYTLILGNQWNGGTAYPIHLTRRSLALSVIAGMLFFIGIGSVTVF